MDPAIRGDLGLEFDDILSWFIMSCVWTRIPHVMVCGSDVFFMTKPRVSHLGLLPCIIFWLVEIQEDCWNDVVTGQFINLATGQARSEVARYDDIRTSKS